MESLVQLYMLLAIFCLLLFKSFHEILMNSYLKALVVLLLFISSIKMLTTAGIIPSIPLVYLSGNIALFLFIPAVYLYLRNQVNNQAMTRKDLAHLLPVVGYSLSCLMIYLFFDKIRVQQANIFNEASGTQGPPLIYFLLFGHGVTGWYLILVLTILKVKYTSPKKSELILPATVYASKEPTNNPRNVELNSGTMYLSDEKIVKMDVLIKEFLIEDKPFLRHGYSLKQLAEDTGIPLHLLSAFINKQYKVNFNDSINEYRVNYCKTKILNDEWKYKKLEAIADESGFSNRNTFTAAFKRVTGQNPSEFLKTIKENQAA